MGFDIECIIDLQSYPGEYFCPVCRTLVYPDEALQAQCTHVYCKPCLTHIANGTRACPYDGYLVTESDSKKLLESDKQLAEKIGKVKVHCLFFRSGCTWEGTLSDSASHGSVCSFGNSPVICNRCGIQIVHRQVHEHAQVCPGVYDGQVAATGVTRSGTNSSTVPAVVNQAVSQTGPQVSQAQNPQNVATTPLPVQNSNVQTSQSHNPTVASVAVAAPDQWSQQQYQQYYQQYVGYDPYQQQQQYYALQQQPFQQYPQHQVPIQGQQQSHVYSQAIVQPQAQSQPQVQPHQHQQLQSMQQPHLVHPVPQNPPQMQSQGQVQTQGQPQGQAHVQAVAPNYQVNPQQPLHPSVRPQTQIPQQVLPPPPSQSTQPSQLPQAIGTRPPAHNQQVPQYQQPQGLMHQPQASQAHMQPQMHPQTQPYTQSSNQIQPPYQSQSQPPVFHPQSNQTTSSGTLPQVAPVSGHQSYQQPLPAQNMQPGALQQHPVQVHGQVPQQPAVMRPSQPHGLVSQQPSTLLPTQNNLPGAPHAPNQQFLPPVQQPTYPVQHRPMQSVQQFQPSNYAQQQQSLAPYQGQMHQLGHLPPPQSMQSQVQMRAPVTPQPQQYQNYVGTPMLSNQGIHAQNHPVPPIGYGPHAPAAPAQPASTQISVNQNHAKPAILEQNATSYDIRSPSKRPAEKSFEGESLKDDIRSEQKETASKDANNAAKDSFVKSIKQEKADMMGDLEQSFRGKASGSGFSEGEFLKEEAHSLTDSVQLKQASLDNHTMLSKTADGPSTASYDRQSLSVAPPSSTEGNILPQEPHGSYGPQHVVRPNEVAMPRDRMMGSGEGRPLVKPHADEPNFFRSNGGSDHDSKFGPRDENMKPVSREQFNLFPSETSRPLEQGSRPLDKQFHGPIYDVGPKFESSDLGTHSGFLPHRPSGGQNHRGELRLGSEFGQHHIKPFAYQSPGGDYLGSPSRRFGALPSLSHGSSSMDGFNSKEPYRFGEGSMSSSLPSDLVGNSFRDGRFPPLPGGHLRRGDLDGPTNPRYGELMPPGQIFNQIGSGDAYWRDGPGHLARGKPPGPGYPPGQAAGPGTYSGHGYPGDFSRNFPRPPFSEPMGGNIPGFLPYGDPTTRNNYQFHGFPNAGNFTGGLDSIDQSRIRKPPSTGWCRICEFDCETVEGLEMHSQTRDHQNMAIDMVKSIKLKNKKKHRAPGGRMAYEGGRIGRMAHEGGRRKMVSGGRGKRH